MSTSKKGLVHRKVAFRNMPAGAVFVVSYRKAYKHDAYGSAHFRKASIDSAERIDGGNARGVNWTDIGVRSHFSPDSVYRVIRVEKPARYFVHVCGHFCDGTAYARCDGATGCPVNKDGSDSQHVSHWDTAKCASFVEIGHWREISEAEAKALVKP